MNEIEVLKIKAEILMKTHNHGASPEINIRYAEAYFKCLGLEKVGHDDVKPKSPTKKKT